MRYQFSGTNDTLLGATVAATGFSVDASALQAGQYLIGRANTTGRAAWLRWATVYAASGPITVALQDGTAGNVATSSTRRGSPVRCASGQTTMIEFPAPGLKFTTGIVIAKSTTDASGSLDIGNCAGGGYEE